jgi:hypothetical protein
MIDRALAAQNSRIETVYSNFDSEPPAAQSDDPLAPYEGQTVTQGGKSYQVMRGRDGKLMAVEVK